MYTVQADTNVADTVTPSPYDHMIFSAWALLLEGVFCFVNM